MSVSTIILALSLAATPAGAPSRLDPDDIEALEALLRAMDAQAEEQPATEAADSGDEPADEPADSAAEEGNASDEPVDDETSDDADADNQPDTEADASAESEAEPETGAEAEAGTEPASEPDGDATADEADEVSDEEAGDDEATGDDIVEEPVNESTEEAREAVETDEPAPDSPADAEETEEDAAGEGAEPAEADEPAGEDAASDTGEQAEAGADGPDASDAEDADELGASRETTEGAESESVEQAEVEVEADAEPAPADADSGTMASTAGTTPRRMTPHVGMDHYAALRGAPWGVGVELAWQIAVSPLGQDGTPAADSTPDAGARAQSRTFMAGSGWAGEMGAGTVWLYDFSARRLLTLDRENGRYANASIYAGVRRNVDIYAALSQSGQAEEIAFGPSASFHRFWLEAAMGVAAAPADLTSTSRPAESDEDEEPDGTVTSWYRQEDGPRVASAWTGCDAVEMTDEQRTGLIAAFAHRVPIHPDILAALNESGEPLCALAFTVVSPESPDGRVEHWTLAGTSPLEADMLGFAGASLHTGNSALIDDDAHEAVLAALAGDSGPPPEPADFMLEIQSLREEGDFAGAMLTQVQEIAHFGICPAETVGSERLACAGTSALAAAASGDEGYEAVVEATEAAAEGSHRLAIERLLPYLDRRDYAGAAARTIVARQLVEWGEEGLAAHETLDPAGLLAEALEIDPFAVNIYWYLSLRYMAAGAPDEAWFFLDTGRALPGREPTETLAQAAGLERRLEQLAPALFPADAVQ